MLGDADVTAADGDVRVDTAGRTPAQPSALSLSDGVHFCEAGGGFVFLDLRADRYVRLDGSGADALRRVIADGASDGGGGRAEQLQAAWRALAPLRETGLLGPRPGRPLAPLGRPLPEATLLSGVTRTDGAVSAARVMRFLSAACEARRRLRRGAIADTVEHVRRRKADRSGALDVAAACDLTAFFTKLRPFFPVDRRCLFDSLSLIEFLARHGLHPTWTFGVRLDPWKAHCWVEHGGVLFNDTLEGVAPYTPIMAV